VRRASRRANMVRAKAIVTQRSDRAFAPEGAGHASRALILRSVGQLFASRHSYAVLL